MKNFNLWTHKIYNRPSTHTESKNLHMGTSCADPEGRTGGQDPPEKSQIYRVSYQYWTGSPVKPQSYQASIQWWATIGPPEKRHLNGVSLAGRWWPAYSGILILSPLINLKKKNGKKNLVTVGPSLKKTFWIRAWIHYLAPTAKSSMA